MSLSLLSTDELKQFRRLMQQIRTIRWFAHIGIALMLGVMVVVLAFTGVTLGVAHPLFGWIVGLYGVLLLLEGGHLAVMTSVFQTSSPRPSRRRMRR